MLSHNSSSKPSPDPSDPAVNSKNSGVLEMTDIGELANLSHGVSESPEPEQTTTESAGPAEEQTPPANAEEYSFDELSDFIAYSTNDDDTTADEESSSGNRRQAGKKKSTRIGGPSLHIKSKSEKCEPARIHVRLRSTVSESPAKSSSSSKISNEPRIQETTSNNENDNHASRDIEEEMQSANCWWKQLISRDRMEAIKKLAVPFTTAFVASAAVTLLTGVMWYKYPLVSVTFRDLMDSDNSSSGADTASASGDDESTIVSWFHGAYRFYGVNDFGDSTEVSEMSSILLDSGSDVQQFMQTDEILANLWTAV